SMEKASASRLERWLYGLNSDSNFRFSGNCPSGLTLRGRLLLRLSRSLLGLFLLLQFGRVGGGPDRHLIQFLVFGGVLGPFFLFAVKHAFVKHRFFIFRIDLKNLFDVPKPFGYVF